MADNNKSAKNAIKAYLDNRAATDELFAVAYAKENKNLDDCFKYILSEAQKRGSAVCMTDEEVFGLAVHYYDEDEVRIDRNITGRVRAQASKPMELTEEEKEAAKEAAKRRYEQECYDKMKKASKKPKAPAQERVETPTLFDFSEEEQ